MVEVGRVWREHLDFETLCSLLTGDSFCPVTTFDDYGALHRLLQFALSGIALSVLISRLTFVHLSTGLLTTKPIYSSRLN